MRPEDLSWPDEALTVRTSRASGAGGQHVNRTDSKVDLALDLRLVPGLPAHLLAELGPVLRVTSQRFRSQVQNMRAAQERLRERLAEVWDPPEQRVPTQVPRSQKRRRVQDKLHAGQKKRDRGPVRSED